MIREALRVLVGAADLEGTRALAQGGRRVLIVDAPARIVDEGLTAPRPPRVGALHVAGQVAHRVVPALVHPLVEEGNLFRHRWGSVVTKERATGAEGHLAHSYTSETESAPAGAGQSITAPGAGLGRRKEAVARVRLVPGSGKWTINGRTLEDYFPNKLHQQLVKSPFVLLDIDGRFDVIARINGGGVSGQAGALRLGVSRALNEIDRDANRPALKKAGFLTRDARATERKKAGLKKARKASQFSKR